MMAQVKQVASEEEVAEGAICLVSSKNPIFVWTLIDTVAPCCCRRIGYNIEESTSKINSGSDIYVGGLLICFPLILVHRFFLSSKIKVHHQLLQTGHCPARALSNAPTFETIAPICACVFVCVFVAVGPHATIVPAVSPKSVGGSAHKSHQMQVFI